jgi:hypothetical protein
LLASTALQKKIAHLRDARGKKGDRDRQHHATMSIGRAKQARSEAEWCRMKRQR